MCGDIFNYSMLNKRLNIAVLPYDIVWGDKEENLLSIELLLSKIDSKTDVVVLPELFSTGIISDEEMMYKLSESNSKKIINSVHSWSKKFNFAICGSFIATTTNKYYNRIFFVEPSGEETFYDKRHLSINKNEAESFLSGTNESPIIRYRGWNLKLISSDDLFYPLWCRNIQNNYDTLLVVSNNTKEEYNHIKHLLSARAIENQAYVVNSNRSGKDDLGEYEQSSSAIYDYRGANISRIENDVIYAELSQIDLFSYRKEFPIWRNADKFQLLK